MLWDCSIHINELIFVKKKEIHNVINMCFSGLDN